MSGNNYLIDLLKSQALGEGCDEWKALDVEAAKIERIVREAYPHSLIMFTHGGSRAKGTMIREDYDLDEVCYFQNDDISAGDSLQEIYESIAALLAEYYTIRRKRSALRLSDPKGKDVRVDVVPGRYVDLSSWDVFIHQNEGDKERLKTNIRLHIEHVKESGCTDVIMLTKLWRTRNRVDVKTFPLELLVIAILKYDNSGDLEPRFRRVLTAFAGGIHDFAIVDPANPTGNDLSAALTDVQRRQIAKIASNTLQSVDAHGWEQVFGKLERVSAFPRVQVLQSAAAAAPIQTRPWAYGGE